MSFKVGDRVVLVDIESDHSAGWLKGKSGTVIEGGQYEHEIKVAFDGVVPQPSIFSRRFVYEHIYNSRLGRALREED